MFLPSSHEVHQNASHRGQTISSFVESVTSGVVNVVCLVVGVVAALLLDKFNRKVEVPE